MSPCDSFIPDLVDAASGELPAARRALLDTHLSSCAACRDELAGLSETTGLLSLTREEPDELTLSGFARRTVIAAEEKRDRTGPGRLGRWLRTLGWVTSAAGAAAVALLVAQPGPVKPPTPAPVALDEIATAEELLLWEVYVGDAPTSYADSQTALSLDDGLSGLTDGELAELVAMLDDGTRG